jgi:hypothetical protein
VVTAQFPVLEFKSSTQCQLWFSSLLLRGQRKNTEGMTLMFPTT